MEVEDKVASSVPKSKPKVIRLKNPDLFTPQDHFSPSGELPQHSLNKRNNNQMQMRSAS